MPVITAQDVKEYSPAEVTFDILDGTDTFVLAGNSQLLQLTNGTGAQVDITILGDAAVSEFQCQGFGSNTVSPVAVSLQDGESFAVYLNPVSKILAGTATITGGTGLDAAIFNI